jgi:hypothetical protein
LAAAANHKKAIQESEKQRQAPDNQHIKMFNEKLIQGMESPQKQFRKIGLNYGWA